MLFFCCAAAAVIACTLFLGFGLRSSLSLSLWEMLFISPLLISYTHTMLLLTCPFKVPLLSFVKDSFLLPTLLPVFPPTRPARILLSRSKERVKPQFWLQARNKFPRVNLSPIFKPADINCVKKWSSCRDKLIVILKNLFLMNTNIPRFVMHTILPA